jgi:hypothetical protein
MEAINRRLSSEEFQEISERKRDFIETTQSCVGLLYPLIDEIDALIALGAFVLHLMVY